MKPLFPAVVRLVSASGFALLALIYIVIINRCPDLKWIGCQISHGIYRMLQQVA